MKYLISEFEFEYNTHPNHLLSHPFPIYLKSKFSYEGAFTTSLEQNATMVGENLQNFTSEIARNAMNCPTLMIIGY